MSNGDAAEPAGQTSSKLITVADIQPRSPPQVLAGTVTKGFGRGSKMLGIPTANLPIEELGSRLEDMPAGVYAGWARVDRGDMHKTVLSIGWNPYFKNSQKTVEPHIMHKFDGEFYGAHLEVAALAYLRPEQDYPSLDALTAAIHNDIAVAEQFLDEGTRAEAEAAMAAA